MAPTGAPSSRAALVAARALAVGATVACVTAVSLAALATPRYVADMFATPEAIVGPSFAGLGALLVGLPAARRIGWLLVTIGSFSAVYAISLSASAFALGYDGTRLRDGPADGTVEGAVAVPLWLATWAWAPAFLLVSVLLLQVVPFGKALPGRWLILLRASLAFVVLFCLMVAFAPVTSDTLPGVENPLAVDSLDRWTGGLELASNIVLGVLALSALASFVVRVVRAGATERRQLAWVGLGIVSALVAVSLAPWWGVGAAVLLVPAGLALAAYRYRLYDVDLIVSRALVAGVLLGGAALVYVAVVGWVGALVDSSGSAVSFAAAFAVALAFHPARVRVQRGVDRLLYGQRGDPSALLARLDDAVRSAGSSRDALQDGVALVAGGLKLPYVAAEVPLRSGEVVRTASGEHPGSPPHVLDLVLHGEHVGRLLAAARPGTGGLGRADLRALSVVAGPFANAAFALRMAGDLEESRERLVTAREEERRRLRRDMHDGLGPQMSGVVMCLDTAAAALRRDDPDRAAELVAAATGQAQEAVADVRRLVHGLRPPALDDLGLAGALRALESTVAEGGMRMTVTCNGNPDGLPAAVEVAAFRIAQEALTNAVRHAGGTTVAVSLDVADEVVVSVVDDGVGIPAGRVAGVGLASMRERAAEVGGSLEVSPAAPHGTRVTATFPIPSAVTALPAPREV